MAHRGHAANLKVAAFLNNIVWWSFTENKLGNLVRVCPGLIVLSLNRIQICCRVTTPSLPTFCNIDLTACSTSYIYASLLVMTLLSGIPWSIPYLYFLYTTASLYSDWLYFLWHGIKYFIYSWVVEGTVRYLHVRVSPRNQYNYPTSISPYTT